MKIALKNFLSTLRRYKMASLLNIVGLTMAFTAFYIIMAQVWWELGYNRSLPDAERICLVQTGDWYSPGRWSSQYNRPVAEHAIPMIPEIEYGGCMWGGFGETTVCRQNAEKTGYDRFIVESWGMVSRSFIDVFGFRAVAGNFDDMEKRGTAILSRETAKLLGVGIGDLIWIDPEDEPTAESASEVVALFEDFADNSLLGTCKIVTDLGERNINNYSEWSFNYFVKLQKGATGETVAQRWRESIIELVRQQNPSAEIDEENPYLQVRMSPVGALYFLSDARVPCAQGSRTTTWSLLGIALLVILLAFVNFVNFFFALVPVRIRTVNTFKVFGAPTSSLRFSYVFEAVGLVAIALVLSSYLVLFIRDTEFAGYVSASLALGDNPEVAAISAAVGLAMAVIASCYPAWYITSFNPALVVKGSFGGSRSGRLLRTALLGFQFFVSMVLIVSVSFIRLQHNYMMNYDMGFDRHDMLAVWLPDGVRPHYAALRDKLMADPRVEDVTGAASNIVSVNRMGWGRDFKGERVAFQSYIVQWNFLEMMGIEIEEGRDFLEEDMRKELGSLIFNRTAAKKYSMTVGDRINGFLSPEEPIVGICRDFNFQPLQYAVQPFAFYILPETAYDWGPDRAANVLYLRYRPGADVAAVTELLRTTIAGFDGRVDPAALRIHTFETELGAEYAAERKLTTIVSLFALLSVVISLMGVFGLVLFETQHRRREIAVRKVMGASTEEVLALFNRRYVVMAVLCFLAAAPVSVWAVVRYLSSFAYRTPVVWWVFAAAFVAVLAVTVLTVTVRSWHTANENPVDSVKNE